MPKAILMSDRVKMVELSAKGKKADEIANDLKCSVRSVQNWLSRWKKNQSLDELKRSGRKSVLTSGEKTKIVSESSDDPELTCRDIKESMELPCTARTINNVLLSAKLRTFKSVTKPALFPDHINARLIYANHLKDWSSNDWMKVIFTDEKIFSNHRVCCKLIRRKRGTPANYTQNK